MTRRNSAPKLPALIATAFVAVCLAALPTSAGAAQKSAKSNVTLKIENGLMKRLNPFTASGRVGSKVGRCERRRQVELTYRPPEGGAQPYGEDATNKQGRYEIILNVVPPGRYVAKVLPAKRGETACKGGRSKPVVVSEVW